ncbi:MAG: SUMF1/EgtB/PvdO family nonheme iron enzyme [Nitrospinales bacterium]
MQLFRLLFLLTTLAAAPGFYPAEAAEQDPPRDNRLEADMVLIPAGIFSFGTDRRDATGNALSVGIPKPWYADENPQQRVFLKAFYMDRYEVTNRRYKIYVDAAGAIPPPHWRDNRFPEGRGDDPVTEVNWFDAANFCAWAGKRLPTEKEWERAARGPNGNEYPWGNEFHIENANLAPKAGGKTKIATVGSFPGGASPEGAHDLIGNVWEWTASDYAPYKGGNYRSPQYDGRYKVLRGASAAYIGHFPGVSYEEVLKQYSRGGYRQPALPDDAAPDVGFRCVGDKKPKVAQTGLAASVGGDTLAGGFSGKQAEPAGRPGGASEAPQTASSVAEASAVAPFNPFEAKPNLPQSGILVLIFLSFLAGVLSFLSPCTLPILPAYFAVTAQAERARMSMMSVAFFFGLATLFVLMGASASFAGKILRDYMDSLTTYGGAFVVVFGIMTLFGKGFSGASFRSRPASTYAGSFMFGATFALGWTPCVGPILSGILILAATDKTIVQAMILLFSYALGLGLPLIVISTFFGHLSKDSLFWRILRGKGWDVQVGGRVLLLHTTNLFSGLLLIALGAALMMGYLTYLNSLIPIEAQIWFSNVEEKILHWFM